MYNKGMVISQRNKVNVMHMKITMNYFAKFTMLTPETRKDSMTPDGK